MIRPLEDDDVEFIRLHYKISNKELGQLMGLYKALVQENNGEIRNLCFYEYPNVFVKCYGSSDFFVDYLEDNEAFGVAE